MLTPCQSLTDPLLISRVLSHLQAWRVTAGRDCRRYPREDVLILHLRPAPIPTGPAHGRLPLPALQSCSAGTPDRARLPRCSRSHGCAEHRVSSVMIALADLVALAYRLDAGCVCGRTHHRYIPVRVARSSDKLEASAPSRRSGLDGSWSSHLPACA